MAIGDTVQAGLMRIDPSAILRAGEAQARVGERIGQTVGGLATTYFDTKRRNKELEGERKGLTDAFRMVGKYRPELRDETNAQIEFLEDPEQPLSTRVAAGIRSLQNIDRAEKLRSARQAEQLAADKFASEKRLADFKLASDQLGFTKDIFDLMEKRRKSEEADIVQPVLDVGGRPIPALLRKGDILLRQEPTTKEVSILGTGSENVVDRPTITTPEPSIEKFDPEKGFVESYGTTLEDIGQSVFRKLGGKTQEEIFGFKLKGSERLRAKQMVRVIGSTIRKPLMEVFGGKMTNQQIDLINESIPLESDQTEEGMEKLRASIRLLKQKRSQANDVLVLSNPETENYAKATSVIKEIDANLPIIEEIVNKYYGNIPTEGMGTMGSISNLDEVLKSDEFLKSLPRDTNKTKSKVRPLDIISQ